MYLPTPETLAALGFGPAEYFAGLTPSMRYTVHGFSVSVWPRDNTVMLHRKATSSVWVCPFEGPVADEAAFRALVARHFPALT